MADYDEKEDLMDRLLALGKRKKFLSLDELHREIPENMMSPDDLEDVLERLEGANIPVAETDAALLERAQTNIVLDDEEAEPVDEEDLDLDLSAGALDKSNDPVRMYLREMGTVPLLTREGEVAIAKRIERGQLAVIKSISRTPTIAKRILTTGDQLRAGERTIRELVIFSDEEITDEVIQERKEEVLEQIEVVRKARAVFVKLAEKLQETPRKDKRKYRRARWKALRARIDVSRAIRR